MENKQKEFNLSEKLFNQRGFSKTQLLMKEDIKEFIKRLKEEVEVRALNWDETIEEIDKLAGDKLI